MVASKYGQVAVAELLLLAGADYFLRNKVSAAAAMSGLARAFVLGRPSVHRFPCVVVSASAPLDTTAREMRQ
jgi:hypothetical protein